MLWLCCLFFVSASWRLLRDEELSVQQVAASLPWLVPFLAPYLLPLAWMTTLALVYGRLVADQEVLAFLALGVPQRALARPALFLGGALSLCVVWLSATVVPYCYQQSKEVARAVFTELFALGEGEHFSRAFPTQGFDLYVRRHGPAGLEGIVLHFDLGGDPSDPTARCPVQVVAARGEVRAVAGGELELELRNVTATIDTGRERYAALTQPRAGTTRAPELPAVAPPVRLRLERWVQRVGLGGRRRLRAMDYATADLRRLLREEEQRRLLLALQGGFVGTQQGRGERWLEARREMAMRAATSATPLVLTALVVPLVLLLQARNALVSFAAAVLAGCLLCFVPLLIGLSLSEASGRMELVGVGPAVSLLAGAALAVAAARR